MDEGLREAGRGMACQQLARLILPHGVHLNDVNLVSTILRKLDGSDIDTIWNHSRQPGIRMKAKKDSEAERCGMKGRCLAEIIVSKEATTEAVAKVEAVLSKLDQTDFEAIWVRSRSLRDSRSFRGPG